jgi:hypothetical protein
MGMGKSIGMMGVSMKGNMKMGRKRDMGNLTGVMGLSIKGIS